MVWRTTGRNRQKLLNAPPDILGFLTTSCCQTRPKQVHLPEYQRQAHDPSPKGFSVRHGAGLEAKAFASVYRATSARSSSTTYLSFQGWLRPSVSPVCLTCTQLSHSASQPSSPIFPAIRHSNVLIARSAGSSARSIESYPIIGTAVCSFLASSRSSSSAATIRTARISYPQNAPTGTHIPGKFQPSFLGRCAHPSKQAAPSRLVVMMMDPAGSLEVTIDSLLSAIASASLAVTNFIRSVRSARTDLVQVTRELSDLRLELELLRDEHNVPRRPQSHARAVLDSCGVVLRRIGSLLGDSLSKADAGRPPRWSVKERFETTNLCNCLQVYREALTILLEMANLYVDPRPFLFFVRLPWPVPNLYFRPPAFVRFLCCWPVSHFHPEDTRRSLLGRDTC